MASGDSDIAGCIDVLHGRRRVVRVLPAQQAGSQWSRAAEEAVGGWERGERVGRHGAEYGVLRAKRGRASRWGLCAARERIYFHIEMIDIETMDVETMPTHFKGTDTERAALDAYIKLMRASSAINSRLMPVLQAEFGITSSQLGVLEVLSHLGPMAHCALAGKLLVSASNLTTVLDNLERDGLVRRDRDVADRRVSIASLTPAGEARLASFFPQHVQRLVQAMAGLDAAELEEFGRLCRKLGHAAADSHPGRVAHA